MEQDRVPLLAGSTSLWRRASIWRTLALTSAILTAAALIVFSISTDYFLKKAQPKAPPTAGTTQAAAPTQPIAPTEPSAPEQPAATIASRPAVCVMNVPAAPAKLGNGVVTGFEDRATSLARIPETEDQLKGQIDPAYYNNPRATVQMTTGEVLVALVPFGLTAKVGDIVVMQGLFRSPLEQCNYIPPMVVADLGGGT